MRETPLTRRSFVAGGILTAGLGVARGPVSKAIAGDAARTSGDPWQVLVSRISGQVLRPGDPGFDALALPYNLREASVRPAGIARCLSANDVALAITWARRYHFPLVARSGGHSAGDYSVTTGLMIDTKLIKQARFDTKTGIATIGGGTLNSGVYTALEQNNATITHGRCPTVGAAGFLLGGGVGFNIRRLGVASDALVASQIVTADGEILNLSASQNPDLFWACRGGGGGNFGINTSFSVQTTPVPGSITASRLLWNSGADKVFPALLAALDESPVSLGSWTTVSAVTPQELASGKDVSTFFEGQLIGTPGELRRILAPAYAAGQPDESTVKEMGYWDAQENFFADVEEPTEFQNRALYFRGPISQEAIGTLLHWLRRWPGTSIYARISFLQTGGQANAIPPTATAFVHRDNDWYMLWYLKWSRKDSAATVRENLAWLSAFYDAMAPYAIPEAYQNFVDPSLRDYLSQYYGQNVPRLERIKAAVDPRQVFNFPQAIPPSR
ncbi:MAG TPA: FAD-binding oxidoreductase [Streptosporangiaceae bacterium]|nr:FAD-binding oxidoreductase [Streptosporangiaceae bacterium]